MVTIDKVAAIILWKLVEDSEWYAVCTFSKSCRVFRNALEDIQEHNPTLKSFISGIVTRPFQVWKKPYILCSLWFRVNLGKLYTCTVHIQQAEPSTPLLVLQTNSGSTSLTTRVANIGGRGRCNVGIDENVIYLADIRPVGNLRRIGSRTVGDRTELMISIREAGTHKEVGKFTIHCNQNVRDCSLSVCDNKCYVYTVETIGEAYSSQELEFKIFCVESDGTNWSCVCKNTITVGGLPLTTSYLEYAGMRGYAYVNTASTRDDSDVEHRLVFGLRQRKWGSPNHDFSIAVRVDKADNNTFIDVSEENSNVIQSNKYILFDTEKGNMVLLGENSYQPTPGSSEILFPEGIKLGGYVYEHTVLRDGVLSIRTPYATTIVVLDKMPLTPVRSPWKHLEGVIKCT